EGAAAHGSKRGTLTVTPDAWQIPRPGHIVLCRDIVLRTHSLRKDPSMHPYGVRRWLLPLLAAALVCSPAMMASARGACCYFSAKNADILQPAQKVFISWDPVKKAESFTVQPK